jgi:hypothetical protein
VTVGVVLAGVVNELLGVAVGVGEVVAIAVSVPNVDDEASGAKVAGLCAVAVQPASSPPSAAAQTHPPSFMRGYYRIVRLPHLPVHSSLLVSP